MVSYGGLGRVWGKQLGENLTSGRKDALPPRVTCDSVSEPEARFSQALAEEGKQKELGQGGHESGALLIHLL